jgi:predicted dehydrogenase
MKQDQRLRIGVLGCGMISQAAHFESCIKARNADLYAVCDAAPDLLAKAQATFEPRKTYSSYDAMLADPDLDAVIVAIADQFHVAAAKQALAADKHVLVEKPLGVTVAECTELRDLCRSKPELVLQVGNMKRFDPGIAAARDFVHHEMGAKLALKAWYCDSTHRYTATDNLQPVIYQSARGRKPAGNPKENRQTYYLLGHGSHLVDTGRYLGGPIETVRTHLAERFGAYCWFVDTRFADGSVGHLDLTIAVRMDWHEGFQIYGEFGSVIGKTFNPWYFRSSEVECFSEREGQYRRVLGVDAHFFRLQVEAFADTILLGKPQRGADVEDGLAAIQTLAAIAESARTGKDVPVAEAMGAV